MIKPQSARLPSQTPALPAIPAIPTSVLEQNPVFCGIWTQLGNSLASDPSQTRSATPASKAALLKLKALRELTLHPQSDINKHVHERYQSVTGMLRPLSANSAGTLSDLAIQRVNELCALQQKSLGLKVDRVRAVCDYVDAATAYILGVVDALRSGPFGSRDALCRAFVEYYVAIIESFNDKLQVLRLQLQQEWLNASPQVPHRLAELRTALEFEKMDLERDIDMLRASLRRFATAGSEYNDVVEEFRQVLGEIQAVKDDLARIQMPAA